MIFSAALDDSSLVSIRKSIYVFASFIAIVVTFEASIDLSGKWFGVIEFTQKQTIAPVWIVGIACLFQAYLTLRLYISQEISFAKIQRAYGTDELLRDDQLSQLVSDLKDMVNKAKSTTPKQTDISNLITGLEEVPELVEQANLLNSAVQAVDQSSTKISTDLQSVVTKLSEVDISFRSYLELLADGGPDEKALRQELMKGSFETELHSPETNEIIIGPTDPRVSPDLRATLQELRQQLETYNFRKDLNDVYLLNQHASNFVSDYERMQPALERMGHQIREVIAFEKAFDSSTLAKATKDLDSKLIDVKQRREREFKWFEFYLPAAIAIFSISYGLFLRPYFTPELRWWEFLSLTHVLGAN